MKKPPVRVMLTVAERFRAEILQAEAEGANREDMLLQLSHSDVYLLQRDRKIAVSDISFAGGEMRFLGVKVERGGVAESALVIK